MDATMSAPTTDARPVPAVIDIVLEVEKLLISFVRFNRLGTYIACGAVNGYLALVDFITKDANKIWNAHTMAVSAISWTRDGRQIFSTAIDNTMAISDVATGTVIRQFFIGAALQFAELNPRDSDNYLSLTKSGIRIRTFKTFQKYSQIEYKQKITAITYDHTGNYIVCGTLNGYILTYELNGRKISESVIDSPSQIKHLYPSRRVGLLIITASDRYIRIAEMATVLRLKSGDELSLVNSLSDASNKSFWHSACASGLADHIAGLCSAAHMVTIWERATNTIVTTLIQSKKEVPTSIVWHPFKPVVASVCDFKLYIWKQKPRPSYAAYAPDFKEIGENMEYQEKESEFDMYDEDCPEEDAVVMRQSPEVIDIETVLAPKPLCSSDEDESNSHAIFTVIPSVQRPIMPSRPQFPFRMRRKREFETVPTKGDRYTNGGAANGSDYINGNGNRQEAIQNGHYEHQRHEDNERNDHYRRRHRRYNREHRQQNENGNGAFNGVFGNGHKRRRSEVTDEEGALTSGEEADVEIESEAQGDVEDDFDMESSNADSDVEMSDDMGVNETRDEEEEMEVDKTASRSLSRLRDSQASSPFVSEVSAASARASTPSSSVGSGFSSDDDDTASSDEAANASSANSSKEQDEDSKSDSTDSSSSSSSSSSEEDDPQPTRERWTSRSSVSLSDSELEEVSNRESSDKMETSHVLIAATPILSLSSASSASSSKKRRKSKYSSSSASSRSSLSSSSPKRSRKPSTVSSVSLTPPPPLPSTSIAPPPPSLLILPPLSHPRPRIKYINSIPPVRIGFPSSSPYTAPPIRIGFPPTMPQPPPMLPQLRMPPLAPPIPPPQLPLPIPPMSLPTSLPPRRPMIPSRQPPLRRQRSPSPVTPPTSDSDGGGLKRRRKRHVSSSSSSSGAGHAWDSD